HRVPALRGWIQSDCPRETRRLEQACASDAELRLVVRGLWSIAEFRRCARTYSCARASRRTLSKRDRRQARPPSPRPEHPRAETGLPPFLRPWSREWSADLRRQVCRLPPRVRSTLHWRARSFWRSEY